MRLSGAIVAAVLVVATPAFSPPSSAADVGPTSRFSDVDDDRFFTEPVGWARQTGVINGYTDHCFLPDAVATRAEVVTVIHRAMGSPAALASHPFTDLTGEWQDAAVGWAAETGVTTGIGMTTFAPDRAATRAEVATFIWRAAGRPAGTTMPFLDVTRDWQRPAVAWMAEAGITTGRDERTFAPDAHVTRGELVTFVWRWFDRPEGPLQQPGPLRNCAVDTGRCVDLFAAPRVAAWQSAHPNARFTAAVHDHRTGCTYHLHPELALTTASVIKAQVLAGVLLQAQDGGRSLTGDEVAKIELMMHYSHNRPPTSELYVQVGGAAGMEGIDARFGIVGTSHTSLYGATVSTAEDRTRLVEQLLIGGGPLGPASVAVAWEWMRTVSAAQSWGASAALPDGHSVALKNGFYPMSGRGWRVGTTGVVEDPDEGRYALTVMTDGNPTEAAGIALVEAIAGHVNRALTAGEPGTRAHDAITCTEPVGATSWEAAAATLGGVDAATLRLLNGGEAAPLSGQRVCRP